MSIYFNPFTRSFDFGIRKSKYFLSDFLNPIVFKNRLPLATHVLTGSDPSELQNVITAAPAGSVICVRSDTEYNPITIPALKPLCIYVDSGYSASINAGGTEYCIGFEDNANGVFISGFSLHNQRGIQTSGGVRNAGAVCALSPAKIQNITLHKLHIYDCQACGINLQRLDDSDMIPIMDLEDLSRNLQIISCDIEDVASEGSYPFSGIRINDARDVILFGNQILDSDYMGIYCENVVHANIGGNYCYNCNSNGIRVNMGPPNPVSRAFIFDNIVYQCGSSSFDAGLALCDFTLAANNTIVNCPNDGIKYESPAFSVKLLNNLIVNSGNFGISEGPAGVRGTVLYNVVFNSGNTDFSYSPTSFSNSSFDPKFINVNSPPSGLQLSTGSPAWWSGFKGMPVGSMIFDRNLDKILQMFISKQELLLVDFKHLLGDFPSTFIASYELSNRTSVTIGFNENFPTDDYAVFISLDPSNVTYSLSNKTKSSVTVDFSSSYTGTLSLLILADRDDYPS